MATSNAKSAEPKKQKSGAKITFSNKKGKENQRYISGWMHSSQHGLQTFFCFKPAKPSKGTKSGNTKPTRNAPEGYEKWLCNIEIKGSFQPPVLTSCLYNPVDKSAFLPDHNIMIKTQGTKNPGGWMGYMSNKRG